MAFQATAIAVVLATILTTTISNCQQQTLTNATLPLDYPAKVLQEQEGTCPPDEQLSGSRAAITDDIRTLLNQSVLSLLNAAPCYPAGIIQDDPVASCSVLCPTQPSGYYWIEDASNSTGNAVQVYCDMDTELCGITGGWTRAAYLNMTDPTEECPSAWREITSPVRVCGRSTGFLSCNSASYASHAMSYGQVCGRVIGYQYCTTDAFHPYNSGTTIDDVYVEGVTITHGFPREHIWTFASAWYETYDGGSQYICPCTNVNYPHSLEIPPWVGNDYFCDSGAYERHTTSDCMWFLDDPLWDGQGCGSTSTCCEFNSPPWFNKVLPEATTDDIEVRLCGSGGFLNDEDSPVQLIEIYVR